MPDAPALFPDCRCVIIYGGSFDPPHIAHVALPEEARVHLGADAIAYVPTANQPLKKGRYVSPAEHRLAMLRLALADQPHAVVLTDELDRAGDGKPSYTVDTLESLRRRMSPDTRMRLLIGADQARDFFRWHKADRVAELAEPAVMMRPPDTAESLLAGLDASLDAGVWRRRIVPVSQIDVSATAIRAAVRAAQSIDGMVPPAVAAYIAKLGLYRDM